MEQASKGTAKNMQDIDEDSDYSNTKEETNALGLETSPKKIDHGDRRDEIWDVSVSPDGEKIVSVSNDQIVKVWMISTGKCVLTLHGHQGMVCSVTCLCSSNGEWIGSGGSDTTVKLWRMSTGECVLTIRGHEDWVGCMTISADGEKIVSGSRDKTVKVWNFSTGECLSTLVHQGGVTGVSLSADGQRIVSCCNGAVKVWRMSTGECLSTLEGHQNYISSVSMTSDGEKIISSSGDKTIKVWSMLTGECLSTLEGHRADVMDSLVTAVGGWIISGSSDHTVKVWSLSTGECELTLRGHQGGVTCVSATADGDKIISGSLDGTVKVWNRATGKCLSTFESDQDHIRDVVISADDQKESSGNDDPPLPLSLAPAKIITKSKIDQATALNDNAKGIDRLEYLAYAKALFSMLHRASPPICVGLFAKWGAGKSFMMHLLKQEFDPMSEEDPNTFEIIQWFDVRFTGNHRSTQVKETQNICWARCCRCLKVFSKWLGTDSSSFSSFTLAWGLLLKELFEEFYQDLMSISSGGYQPLSQRDLTSNSDSNSFHFTDEGNENQTHSHSHSTSKTFRGFPLNRSSNPSVSPERADHDHDDDHDDDHDEEKGPTRTESFSKKSYVFVDFNAWEFNKSDQLWVGLIRNIYRTVERRLEVSQEVNDNGNSSSNGNSNGVAVDYKQLWRAQRAKQEVIRSYGGIKALRLRILFLFFCFFLLFICMILALCYLTKLIHFFESHQGGGVVSVLTFLIFLIGTLYPIFEMIFRTEKETNTSRGESIYNEAADGRDKLGFLNHVRNELDELFQFLHKTYQQRTGISLTLVLFIDDLDRCVGEGRIVSVLEALQLLLNIPGAPVIAFLAVDSRIIASSIETTLNKCVDLQDTPVTGWEYLDKIIQVPFCLPTPPPHKIQRILASALAGKDFALSVVAERLRDLMNQLQARQDTLNLSSIDSLSLSIRFLEEGESEGEGEGKGKEDELKQTRSLPISEFLSSLDSCKENDENLICQAAKSVLSKYVATVEERSRGLAKKERLELLCRSVNFCLYHFDFVFEVSSDQETSCSSPALAAPLSDKEEKKQERQSTEEEEKEKEVVEAEAEQEKKKIKVLNQYQSILSHISSSSRPPLVQPEVLTALNEISLYLEPNPRKLKRLANILQLVTEVANYKPISEANQTQKLSMVPKWSLFSLKIVKWIGLSECYPFRTSLLVYILEDIDLKQAYGVRNPTGLLHYEGVRSIDFENMTLVEFYYEFVSLLIRNIPQFKKLNRLDGDPELFISYLSLSMSGLPAENRVLLCSDILGPIIDKKKRVRDLNFSLLSHSYNLNSAMRNVIALEVQTSRRPLFPLSRRDNRRGERREGERRGGERRWDESEINERGMSERERWMEQNRQGRKR
jgi:WD40 repeat protein